MVLGIGAARLLVYDSWRWGLTGAGVTVLWVHVTRWTGLVALAGAAWLGAAALIRWARGAGLDEDLSAADAAAEQRAAREWWPVGHACLGVGLTLLGVSLIHEQSLATPVAVAFAWLGVVAAVLGRRLSAGGLLGYAIVLIAVPTPWMAVADWRLLTEADAAARLGGLVFTRWSLGMMMVGAAWFAVRHPVRRYAEGKGTEWSGLPPVLLAAAVASVFASVLGAGSEAPWVCGVWLALSAIVLASNRISPTARLDRIGLGGLAATLSAWVWAFPAQGWSSWRSGPGLHPGLLMAFAIVAVAGAAWRFRGMLRTAFEPAAMTARALAVCLIALLFAATSLEVARIAGDWASDERARKAAVSIWWGLFAIVMVAGGFRRQWPVCRYAGLALLAVATAKALVYDLADITPAWRVASLLGLGLLMMGVALGYSRVAQRLERAAPPGGHG